MPSFENPLNGPESRSRFAQVLGKAASVALVEDHFYHGESVAHASEHPFIHPSIHPFTHLIIISSLLTSPYHELYSLYLTYMLTTTTTSG